MTAVTIQELSQSWNLLNSILEQKASLTLSLHSILKNGTSWMLKSEIYHPFPDSKNRLNEHLNEHNFAIIFHSVFVMPKLKLPVTISCASICFPNKERKSLKASVILTIHY